MQPLEVLYKKKVFLYCKFYGKTLVLVPLFNNVADFQACNFIKKDALAMMISYEICETLKNTYFEEHLRKTVSICFTSKYYNK